MHLKVGLFMAALLALATAAKADLSIVVGNHDLLPNQAGQVIPIFLNADGGEQIQGMNFRVTTGDGGPDVGGVDVAPPMANAASGLAPPSDIVGPGTLFFPNNTGMNDQSFGAGGMITDLETTTAAGFITASPGAQLLGTLVFDTTGFTSGTWTLSMVGGAAGDTSLSPFFVGNDPGLALFIENGNITVVPEPSSVVLGMFAVAGLGAVVIRRRRARG